MMNSITVSIDETLKRKIIAKTQKLLKPLIVLVGPSASGKTAVALELAKKINGEIISADSRQVYKYLDIGTAKPIYAKTLSAKTQNAKTQENKRQNAKTPIVINGIPHYLIDLVEPDERYSAGKFREDAEKVIQQIYVHKKIPLVVGGTGLYIHALIDGLVELPGANHKLRKELENLAKKYGKNYLYQRLAKVDPEKAKKIHPQNLPRIIRALEVYSLTGKPISTWQEKTNYTQYEPKFFGLLWERDKLYQRINERVEKMYQAGILTELKKVLKKGYARNSPGLEGLGYQHLLEYLDGKIKLEEAITFWKRDTRRYAKRQMTWFKKDKRIHWIKIDQPFNPKKIVQKILSFLHSS